MNKDYKYINQFKEISIRSICQKMHLDPSNLYAKRMHPYHVHKVRIELENQLKELNKGLPTRKIKSKKKRIRKKRG